MGSMGKRRVGGGASSPFAAGPGISEEEVPGFRKSGSSLDDLMTVPALRDAAAPQPPLLQQAAATAAAAAAQKRRKPVQARALLAAALWRAIHAGVRCCADACAAGILRVRRPSALDFAPHSHTHPPPSLLTCLPSLALALPQPLLAAVQFSALRALQPDVTPEDHAEARCLEVRAIVIQLKCLSLASALVGGAVACDRGTQRALDAPNPAGLPEARGRVQHLRLRRTRLARLRLGLPAEQGGPRPLPRGTNPSPPRARILRRRPRLRRRPARAHSHIALVPPF